jgi:tryptophan halogenase
VLRSPELGIIGVGEGTSTTFLTHFFQNLKLPAKNFYAEAQPIWKMGIRFLWGPRKEFYYTFAAEYLQRYEHMSRNNGFYVGQDVPCLGYASAMMAKNKVFPRQADGNLQFHNCHAFHIENKKLVAWLENVARGLGVEIIDATVTAETGPEGIAALVSQSGERFTADLYVDASGFRSELLKRALGSEFVSYTDTLFCDRAIIGGWVRTGEIIQPYTTAETMNAGWCWRIDHENFINRGYVYSSQFISDDEAVNEFRQKNPKVADAPRLVKFSSGRYRTNWVKNVVGIGNAVGFVEPLEATALHIISSQCVTLAEVLTDSLCEPPPSLIEHYNIYGSQAWDSIRDFLSIHYRFNTRIDTPFWRTCRNEVKLHDAENIVKYYQENGPSSLSAARFIHSSNTFGMEGYMTLLIGQKVPHQKPYTPTEAENRAWVKYNQTWEASARNAYNAKDALIVFRSPKMRWG